MTVLSGEHSGGRIATPCSHAPLDHSSSAAADRMSNSGVAAVGDRKRRRVGLPWGLDGVSGRQAMAARPVSPRACMGEWA